MKVIIYAIAKNEYKHAECFMASAAEADQVIVLDTGSTDNTVRKLRKLGARVFETKLNPFRFDHARNECLKHCPEDVDIFVSADIDEVIRPGWRKELEAAWAPGTTRGRYLYNWSFNAGGTPAVQFQQNRIHAPGYFWKYAAHEIVLPGPGIEEKSVFLEGVVFDHFPDSGKPRSYLPLLEIDAQENPNDKRCLHYLGREYMFAGHHQESIDMLERYLALPDADWDEERCASRRFIARGYAGLGNFPEAARQCYAAIVEAPHLREPYIDMALIAYKTQDWETVRYMALRALAIKEKTCGYTNDAHAWDFGPYDLLAIACWNLGRIDEGFQYSKKALEMSPGDPRLIQNHEFYLKKAGAANEVQAASPAV